MKSLRYGAMLLLALQLPVWADSSATVREDGPVSDTGAEEAAKLGYKSPTGLSLARSLQDTLSIRLVRTNGSRPIETRGCAKIDFMTHVGRLKTNKLSPTTHGPIYANPYIYVSFQVSLGSGRSEYIEAGIGYLEDDPRTGPYFTPYLRRAPDDVKVGNAVPPKGWMQRTGIRAGYSKPILLPGFWQAAAYWPKQSLEKEGWAEGFDDRTLAAPIGEFCYQFKLNTHSNNYEFDYLIKDPAAGNVPYGTHLEMPSIRKTYSPGSANARIRRFETRLLTTIAVTDEAYKKGNPLYSKLGLGVRWKALVRDSLPGSKWEPFDQDRSRFRKYSYDPAGKILFYELLPTTTHDIPDFD